MSYARAFASASWIAIVASSAIACGGKVLLEEPPDTNGADDAGMNSSIDGAVSPPSIDASIGMPPFDGGGPAMRDGGRRRDAGMGGGADSGFNFPFDAGGDPCISCAEMSCAPAISMCEADKQCAAALLAAEACIMQGGDFMGCAVTAFESNPAALQSGLQIANCIQSSPCAGICGGGPGGG